MRAQEVVTIFSDIPSDATMKTYPELEEWFNKGMYVESFAQTQSASMGKYVITFVLRYYNTALSKDKK
ncbi:MAG: hypothetical protein AB1458_09390 [Bacteroidota bacterium]